MKPVKGNCRLTPSILGDILTEKDSSSVNCSDNDGKIHPLMNDVVVFTVEPGKNKTKLSLQVVLQRNGYWRLMDKIGIDDLLLMNIAVLDDMLNVRAVNSDGFWFAVSVSNVNQMALK